MCERELGDLLEVIIDHRGKTPKKLGGVDFTDSGVPVISAIHIKNGWINWDERRRYVPQWMFERWMPVRLRAGDVLLTSEAPLGEVAQVENDGDLVLSQRLFALRGKRGLLDSTYLRYFLQSSEGQRRLLHRASGTTVFGIRQAELIRVKVPVPPIEEQQRIADVLSALDDLIDTNRDLCNRLHHGAAATYSLALESGFDEVPFGECARFYNHERIPLSKAERSGIPGPYPYYGATGVVDTVGRYLFDTVHILVGEDGSVIQDDGSPVVQMVWGKYWVNNHAHVLSGVGISNGLLRQALLASNVAPLVTGAVQPKLSMGRLKTLRLRLPSDKRVSTRIDELAAAERELSEEIVALTRTRDELLPLLLSGRVRVDGVAA